MVLTINSAAFSGVKTILDLLFSVETLCEMLEFFLISVAISPGITTDTSTLVSFNSEDSPSVSSFTAALEARRKRFARGLVKIAPHT